MGRNAASFKAPTSVTLRTGSFQTSLESATGDRLPGLTLIVKNYRDISRIIEKLSLQFFPESWAPVLPAGGNIIATRNYNRLLHSGLINSRDLNLRLIEKANYYNTVSNQNPSVHFFVIPIVTAENWLAESSDYYKNKTRVLNGTKSATIFGSLLSSRIKYSWIGKGLSSENALELFYKTDHHFSMRGAYYAYCEIMNTLESKGYSFELLFPNNWFTLPDVDFRGSFSRLAGAFDGIKDNFEDASFNLPELTVQTSTHEDFRGDKERYLNGNIPSGLFVNHYSKYFGGNRGLVKYSCISAPERNILVISDSFDNSMEPLIASHYRNTYFLDLRYYKAEIGETFILSDFIFKNSICDVLFFGSQNLVFGLI